MYEIKAIPTRYKHYKFRSKLEAQWAIFFDALEIKWQYELKKFPYKKTSYLPDFYLPEFNLWIEIKPKNPTTLEKNKAQVVANITGENLLIIAGFPRLQKFRDNEGYVALELSDAYIMLCIPSMPHKLVIGINDIFHLLDQYYKLQVLLIFTVFNISLKNNRLEKITDLITINFIETYLLKSSSTQYDWHDFLNKKELYSTHHFIINLPTHIKAGLVEIKLLFIKNIELEKIQEIFNKKF